MFAPRRPTESSLLTPSPKWKAIQTPTLMAREETKAVSGMREPTFYSVDSRNRYLKPGQVDLFNNPLSGNLLNVRFPTISETGERIVTGDPLIGGYRFSNTPNLSGENIWEKPIGLEKSAQLVNPSTGFNESLPPQTAYNRLSKRQLEEIVVGRNDEEDKKRMQDLETKLYTTFAPAPRYDTGASRGGDASTSASSTRKRSAGTGTGALGSGIEYPLFVNIRGDSKSLSSIHPGVILYAGPGVVYLVSKANDNEEGLEFENPQQAYRDLTKGNITLKDDSRLTQQAANTMILNSFLRQFNNIAPQGIRYPEFIQSLYQLNGDVQAALIANPQYLVPISGTITPFDLINSVIEPFFNLIQQ